MPMREQPTRVVLIEDEPFFQEFYAECFQDAGMSDIVVLGTAVGLVEILRNRYDAPLVIVSDLTLPEITPRQFIPDLHRAGIRAPILIQTGSEPSEEIDRWLAQGWISGFFVKGVGVGLMMERIVKVITELRAPCVARLHEFQLWPEVERTLATLTGQELIAAQALLQLQAVADLSPQLGLTADRLESLQRDLAQYLALPIGSPVLRSQLLFEEIARRLSLPAAA